MEPHALLDRYIELAASHGNATQEGDDQAANKDYDALLGVLHALRSTNNDWPELLEKALLHSSPHVQCWAASHLLGVKPLAATCALEKLAGRGGVTAFNAKMILREWRAGTFRE